MSKTISKIFPIKRIHLNFNKRTKVRYLLDQEGNNEILSLFRNLFKIKYYFKIKEHVCIQSNFLNIFEIII